MLIGMSLHKKLHREQFIKQLSGINILTQWIDSLSEMSLYATSKATHTRKRRNIFEGLKRPLKVFLSKHLLRKWDSPRSINVLADGRISHGEMRFFYVLLLTHLPMWQYNLESVILFVPIGHFILAQHFLWGVKNSVLQGGRVLKTSCKWKNMHFTHTAIHKKFWSQD